MLESISLDESRRLYHNPNFEEYIFGQSWSNDKPWKATNLITQSFHEYHEGLIRYFNFVIGSEAAESLNIASVIASNPRN